MQPFHTSEGVDSREPRRKRRRRSGPKPQGGDADSLAKQRAAWEERLRRRREAEHHNSPDRFHDLSPEDQDALRAWVRNNVAPRNVTRPQDSYYLKHVAERAIGHYVGNGELKGALREAGYEPVCYFPEWDRHTN